MLVSHTPDDVFLTSVGNNMNAIFVACFILSQICVDNRGCPLVKRPCACLNESMSNWHETSRINHIQSKQGVRTLGQNMQK